MKKQKEIIAFLVIIGIGLAAFSNPVLACGCKKFSTDVSVDVSVNPGEIVLGNTTNVTVEVAPMWIIKKGCCKHGENWGLDIEVPSDMDNMTVEVIANSSSLNVTLENQVVKNLEGGWYWIHVPSPGAGIWALNITQKGGGCCGFKVRVKGWMKNYEHTGNVTYVVPDDITVISVTPTPSEIVGNSLEWYDINLSSWSASLELKPSNSGNISLVGDGSKVEYQWKKKCGCKKCKKSGSGVTNFPEAYVNVVTLEPDASFNIIITLPDEVLYIGQPINIGLKCTNGVGKNARLTVDDECTVWSVENLPSNETTVTWIPMSSGNHTLNASLNDAEYDNATVTVYIKRVE